MLHYDFIFERKTLKIRNVACSGSGNVITTAGIGPKHNIRNLDIIIVDGVKKISRKPIWNGKCSGSYSVTGFCKCCNFMFSYRSV
jgi:hypothetical protein